VGSLREAERLDGGLEPVRVLIEQALAELEEAGAQLGRYGRLGWTTWLGTRARARDAEDLRLDPEQVLTRAPGLREAAGMHPVSSSVAIQ
jgi:hypothetical protein